MEVAKTHSTEFLDVCCSVIYFYMKAVPAGEIQEQSKSNVKLRPYKVLCSSLVLPRYADPRAEEATDLPVDLSQIWSRSLQP